MTRPTPISWNTPFTTLATKHEDSAPLDCESGGQPLVLPEQIPFAVVLVEPRIPQNTGNIVRLCACTGAELFLIGDLGFRLQDRFLSRAAMDYHQQVQLTHLPSFEALLEQKPGWTAYYATTKTSQSYTEVSYTPNTLLVFGSETTGLPEAFLDTHQDRCIRIPMRDSVRSLNLATSAAIVLYEAIRQNSPSK